MRCLAFSLSLPTFHCIGTSREYEAFKNFKGKKKGIPQWDVISNSVIKSCTSQMFYVKGMKKKKNLLVSKNYYTTV